MGKTITTHNGSVARREHNIRNPKVVDKQGHIDKTLSDGNEILKDEHPRIAYKRIFGPALEEYNAKQVRPERRIKDYYSHIEKDVKKHPVYEMIIQVGDRNDTGIHAPKEREIIKEFIATWPVRNPNLELIGAYLHADERDGTLHAHLDYIPVAHGYKNGMHTQTALVRALGEQGFDTMKQNKVTAQIRWEARENKALEDICNAYGIGIDHPERDKKGVKRRHESTPEYKERMDVMNELAARENVLKRDIDILQIRANDTSKTLEKIQVDVNNLEEQKKGLQEEIGVLATRKDELDSNNTVAELKKETAYREVKQAQQEATVARSEADTLKAEVQSYRELKHGLEGVEASASGLSVPGFVILKKIDYEVITEQAKSYVVNRDEIQGVRRRSAAVGKRERQVEKREASADVREQQLVGKENELTIGVQTLAEKEKKVDAMYNQQVNLNLLFEEQRRAYIVLREEQEKMVAENQSLKAEVFDLRGKLRQVGIEAAENLKSATEGFLTRLRRAYECMAAVVQAVGMLKWDKTRGYRVEGLTKKQGRLIDAISNYGEGWVRQEGFTDIAEGISKMARISKGIENHIRELEPKSWEMER